MRRRGAASSWRECIAFGGAILLISSTAIADYAAGLAAFDRKDYAQAFSEWIESAKAGDAHAQHGLGMLYELGQGVPYADPKAAAGWYQKAADQNYAPAMNNLARLYADGRGVKQDVPKAISLWEKAAAGGNITARFNLGLQYASGAGIAKDAKKAADYMLQAAESGLPEAQFAVASYYRDGIGVEKDLEAARRWFDRAATAGFEPARKELAALEQPAVSSTPAVNNNAAAPTGNQQASQSTETPPTPPESTQAKPAEPPIEAQPQEAARTETSPTEATEQPQPTPSPAEAQQESTEAQPTDTQPAEKGTPPAEEPQAAQAETTPEKPAEGAPTTTADSDLPVADSLTGDARVYRIWLYTSGQEGDARSYWDKLTMQYPGLLKKLDLDLRRYFLGEAKGSVYRVFAGPFDDLGAAQKACQDIKQRFGDQFCRPVLN